MAESSKMKLPELSTRIRNTLDPCVVLMKEVVNAHSEKWKDKGGIYSLAQGIVYWHPPEAATRALKEVLENPDNELHLYGPDEGLDELRSVFTHKIEKENHLSNHDIMVTVGANQAYINCVLTLMEPGKKAVVYKPYYFNHVMALQMTLSEEDILMGPTSDKGVPDVDWLRSQLIGSGNIQMVTIVNPGNPTGVSLPRHILADFVAVCKEAGVWLVLDCTYEYFCTDEAPFDGCFNEPHVIHIFSLSKSYALAGYRCGFIALHRDAENLYGQMLKVQDTIPIAPSRITQMMALGAEKGGGSSWVKQKIQTLSTGRAAILKAVSCLDQPVMGGSGAMYVMVKLPVADDTAVANMLVEEYGVAVIPGSFCGFPGWIRVCYANLPPDRCSQAATRLENGLRSLCSS